MSLEGQSKQSLCAETLDELVEQINSDAAKGDFDKKAKAKLEELAKAADATQQTYAKARDAHWQRWTKQGEQITKIQEHLKRCYPNYEEIISKTVCDQVVNPIRERQRTLDGKLGEPEKKLDKANSCLADTLTQLDAWKDIAGWIGKRLDTNQALIDEICKLDKCEDHPFALYIFFFELQPAHKALDPTEPHPGANPETKLCPVPSASPKDKDRNSAADCNNGCRLEGLPWLIAADTYKDHLKRAWCRWRDAGRSQAEAQTSFDQIKVLRDRLAVDTKPDNKRAKAKEALRNHKMEPPSAESSGGYKSPRQSNGTLGSLEPTQSGGDITPGQSTGTPGTSEPGQSTGTPGTSEPAQSGGNMSTDQSAGTPGSPKSAQSGDYTSLGPSADPSSSSETAR